MYKETKENTIALGKMINGFHTKLLGKKIIHYSKIDSTQKEIWRRIETDDIDNGTIIMADIQTEGIGTHGRKWYTSQEKNIAFSFVLFPDVEVKKLENLTTEIAEVIVEIFKRVYGIPLEIKKPNDIMIDGKKLGGILTETKLQGEIVKDLVIGIGMNTNQTTFDKEIENIATSIQNEFDITVDNLLIIQEFAKEFEERILLKLLAKN